jgi:hypothetical protein
MSTRTTFHATYPVNIGCTRSIEATLDPASPSLGEIVISFNSDCNYLLFLQRIGIPYKLKNATCIVMYAENLPEILNGSTTTNQLSPALFTILTTLCNKISELASSQGLTHAKNTTSTYAYGDDLFTEEGYMKKYGSTVSISAAQQTVETILKRHNLTKEQLHTTQLLHGSSSASLIAFTDYNHREGILLPLGLMEQSQKVPFCGEIIYGRAGINAYCLSTVWLGEMQNVLSIYARQTCWSLENGKQILLSLDIEIRRQITCYTKTDNETVNKEALECLTELDKALQTDNFDSFKTTTQQLLTTIRTIVGIGTLGMSITSNINLREITAKRIAAWEKLNSFERTLVSDAFPVLYGIKSTRKDVHCRVSSCIDGEVGLKGGAQRGEIKVIFVPSEKVDFVKTLLIEHGHTNIAVETLPSQI